MSGLKELIEKYGSLAEIPNWELEKIGYQKTVNPENSSICIKKISLEPEEKRLTPHKEWFEIFQEPIVFSQPIKLSENISESYLFKIYQKIEKMETYEDNFWDTSWQDGAAWLICPQLSNLERVRGLLNLLGPEDLPKEYINSIRRIYGFGCDLSLWLGEEAWDDEDKRKEIKKHLDSFRFDLEKIYSKFKDKDFLQNLKNSYKNFLNSFLSGPENYWNKEFEDIWEKGMEFLKEKLDKSFTEMTLEEKINFLNGIRKENLKLSEEERQLKEKLKKSKPNEESFCQVSKQLKETKEEIKKQLDYINNLRIFFDPKEEELISRVRNKVKDLLEFIHHEQKEIETKILIDGSYKPEIDFRAGEISGDCTAGKPLPFDHPQVHNLKIYFNMEHQGNIYLVEGKAGKLFFDKNPRIKKVEEIYPAWHLEAIQIPLEKKSAEVFLKNFFSKLKEKAKETGVKYFTLNDRPSRWSNFEGMQKAIGRYLSDLMFFYYPNIIIDKKKYSEFQGEGGAFLIESGR